MELTDNVKSSIICIQSR